MSSIQPVILGLDPGTRYLGFALIAGKQLLQYGVRELRNGHRPYDVIGQARSIVLELIARHGPEVVAIEAPYVIDSPRAAVLSTLTQEIHARVMDTGAIVTELKPEQVRRALTGNPKATKYEVAQWLAREQFPQLAPLVPQKPKVPALWLTSRERYWLHMFDALGLAVAAVAPDHVIATIGENSESQATGETNRVGTRAS